MKKGKLYTSYFAQLKKGIGIKISIARYANFALIKELDFSFKGLAPSDNLLKRYKAGDMSWQQYTELYTVEQHRDDFQQDFNKLKNLLDNGKDVTIYCYEGKYSNCHRHIVSSMFKNLGYEVEEI